MTKSSVLLLRHGQYIRNENSVDGRLTTQGRRQARHTAKRLRDRKIAKVFSSDLQRAVETAEIISTKIGVGPVRALPCLREVLPSGAPASLKKRRYGNQMVEEVIGRFLTKPPTSGDTVVVCHGNLIRAVFCRLIGAPVTKWMELGIDHCGITAFAFGEDRKVRLRSFNDTGHLPMELTTG